MKVHEQRDKLKEAIRLALPYIEQGHPPLGAFSIARDDCALVHIDYFEGLNMAGMTLIGVLAEIEGVEPSEMFKRLGLNWTDCDCKSCAGAEASEASHKKHREAYTKVKEWHKEKAA